MERRALGLWETLCALAHDKGHGTANTCMVIYLEGDLDYTIIQQALYKLFCRHPLLRSTYCTETNGDYTFNINADFNSVPIEFITLNDSDSNSWLKYFNQILKEPYDVSQYLWKVTLVTSSQNSNRHYLMLGLHHSILDGASQVSMIHDLLTYYAALQDNNDINVTSLPLILPIEEQLPVEINWNKYSDNLKGIEQKFGPSKEIKFYDFVPAEFTEPKILFCDFEGPVVTKLIQLCKDKAVKVMALINSALLLAAAQVERSTDIFSLHIAVNLRKYAKPKVDPQDVGCFISVVKTIHSVEKNDDLWDLARAYQDQFDENFSLTGLTPKDFELPVIMKFFERPEHSGRRCFSSGFGVSNWGKIDFPERFGTLNFKGIHRGSGRQIGDFPYFLHIATINNKIFGAFSYIEPMMKKEWMEKYIAAFRKIIFELT